MTILITIDEQKPGMTIVHLKAEGSASQSEKFYADRIIEGIDVVLKKIGSEADIYREVRRDCPQHPPTTE